MSTQTELPPLPPRPTLDEIDPIRCGFYRSDHLLVRSRKLGELESLIDYCKTTACDIAESDRESYIALLDVATRALQSARHTIDTNLLEISLKTGGVK
ncbi:hypothetical protein Ga0100230_005670 [Opitutaceae bacterium TAV3]|nr:hypothetical protein Ga0100230_005670 [Opitutaceae bacterium TAV3]